MEKFLVKIELDIDPVGWPLPESDLPASFMTAVLNRFDGTAFHITKINAKKADES